MWAAASFSCIITSGIAQAQNGKVYLKALWDITLVYEHCLEELRMWVKLAWECHICVGSTEIGCAVNQDFFFLLNPWAAFTVTDVASLIPHSNSQRSLIYFQFGTQFSSLTKRNIVGLIPDEPIKFLSKFTLSFGPRYDPRVHSASHRN
jgi:hypothetical protein